MSHCRRRGLTVLSLLASFSPPLSLSLSFCYFRSLAFRDDFVVRAAYCRRRRLRRIPRGHGSLRLSPSVCPFLIPHPLPAPPPPPPPPPPASATRNAAFSRLCVNLRGTILARTRADVAACHPRAAPSPSPPGGGSGRGTTASTMRGSEYERTRGGGCGAFKVADESLLAGSARCVQGHLSSSH